MLTKSEIRLLSEIENEGAEHVPVTAVADRLGWSAGHASRIVSTLEKREYLTTERKAGKKLVALTDIQPVEQLGTLTMEFDHVDFPELIAGSALEILYYLDRDRTATELTELSGVSRGTVYRRLNELQRVGIVGKNHSRYELTDPFSSLSELARAVAHHDHRQEALTHTSGVNLIWETHDEYLFSCDADVTSEPFHQTGPAVFEQFDIPLFTRDRLHYLRSNQLSGVTAADLVCHMLLIDDGTRYQTYCLLLIASQNITEAQLTDRAEHYAREADLDLLDLAKTLLTYLDSTGRIASERLPMWEEFKRTAADYDISV